MSNTSASNKLLDEYFTQGTVVSPEEFLRAIVELRKAELKEEVTNKNSKRKWWTLGTSAFLAAGVSIAAIFGNITGKEMNAEKQLLLEEIKGKNELAVLGEETKRVILDLAHDCVDPAKILGIKQKYDTLMGTLYTTVSEKVYDSKSTSYIQRQNQELYVQQSAIAIQQERELYLALIKAIIGEKQENVNKLTAEQVEQVLSLADSYQKANEKENRIRNEYDESRSKFYNWRTQYSDDNWFEKNVLCWLPSFRIIKSAEARKEERRIANDPNWVDKANNWMSTEETQKRQLENQEVVDERKRINAEKREFNKENGNWIQKTGIKIYRAGEKVHNHLEMKAVEDPEYYNYMQDQFYMNVMEHWNSVKRVQIVNIEAHADNRNKEQYNNDTGNGRREGGAGEGNISGNASQQENRATTGNTNGNDGRFPVNSTGAGNGGNSTSPTGNSGVGSKDVPISKKTSFLSPSFKSNGTENNSDKKTTLTVYPAKVDEKTYVAFNDFEYFVDPRLMELNKLEGVSKKMAWLNKNQDVREQYGISGTGKDGKLRHLGEYFALFKGENKDKFAAIATLDNEKSVLAKSYQSENNLA